MKNFHRLIEIAIKLDQHIDDNRRFPNPKTIESIRDWQKELKNWIKENYNDPGIDERKLIDRNF
jgi:vacuolar-type H+-ATPase catalytic subunit A/Vma1